MSYENNLNNKNSDDVGSLSGTTDSNILFVVLFWFTTGFCVVVVATAVIAFSPILLSFLFSLIVVVSLFRLAAVSSHVT